MLQLYIIVIYHVRSHVVINQFHKAEAMMCNIIINHMMQ